MIEPNYATEETIALLEEFDASKKLFEAGAATFRVLIYFVFSILLISYRNLIFFKPFYRSSRFLIGCSLFTGESTLSIIVGNKGNELHFGQLNNTT